MKIQIKAYQDYYMYYNTIHYAADKVVPTLSLLIKSWSVTIQIKLSSCSV